MAALTVFSNKKIYGRFANRQDKKGGRNNEVSVRRGSTVFLKLNCAVMLHTVIALYFGLFIVVTTRNLLGVMVGALQSSVLNHARLLGWVGCR